MAVFPERIILKQTTDTISTVLTLIAPGGGDPCLPGELVIQRGNGVARLYTLDSGNVPVAVVGALKNENKGSLTVSNFGEGSSSFILNAGSVTTNELAANSVTDAKISGPVSIAKGGTGQITANAGLNALLPSQTGNSSKSLISDGVNTSWGIVSYSINDLTDVETITESAPAPSSNQCLKWSSSSGQWKPQEDISIDPPIKPNSPCRTGQIAFDEEYLYCCVAENTWNRAPLSYWNAAEIYPRTIAGSMNTYKPTDVGLLTDPYLSNVSLLLSAEGANNQTTFTDRSPVAQALTRVGSPVISTDNKKFGSSSMYCPDTLSYLQFDASNAWNFGSGDFTIEMWMRITGYQAGLASEPLGLMSRGGIPGSNGAFNLTFTPGNGTTTPREFIFIFSSGSTPTYFYSNSGAGTTTNLNQWYFVAVSRNGTNLKMYLDGVQQGSTHNIGTSSMNYVTTPGTIGSGLYYNQGFIGYLDDVRVTKGLGRYPSNFTPPTEPFNALVI